MDRIVISRVNVAKAITVVVIGVLATSCAANEQDMCADIQERLELCQPGTGAAAGLTCDATLLANYDAIMSMSCSAAGGKADELRPFPETDGFGPDSYLIPFPSYEPEPEYPTYDYSEALMEFQLAIQEMTCAELGAMRLALVEQLLAARTAEDVQYYQSFLDLLVSEMWYRNCES